MTAFKTLNEIRIGKLLGQIINENKINVAIYAAKLALPIYQKIGESAFPKAAIEATEKYFDLDDIDFSVMESLSHAADVAGNEFSSLNDEIEEEQINDYVAHAAFSAKFCALCCPKDTDYRNIEKEKISKNCIFWTIEHAILSFPEEKQKRVLNNIVRYIESLI